VRALAVGARYQGAVHAGGAHLSEGYLLRAGESGMRHEARFERARKSRYTLG
jgi:hypothetical protein